MWSKLSNALKPRGETDNAPPTPAPATLEPSQSAVMSHVFEQHPNLSVFHPGDVPFPAPSPPSSPSKHGRLGLFKRSSKVPKDDRYESSSSLRLPHLPKKVRSTLHINTNGSSSSLSRPSADIVRSSSDAPRPSTDSAATATTPTPYTPIEPTRRGSGAGGSVRSILRDKNTPATGQSVRFFSRDAYRLITPDNSSSGEQPDTFLQRLRQASPDQSPVMTGEETRYFSAKSSPAPPPGDMFSPPRSAPIMPSSSSPAGLSLPMITASQSLTSLLAPIPPPDMSNIFDLSQEHDVIDIPMSNHAPLQDNAVEMSEFEETEVELGRDHNADGLEPTMPPGLSLVDSVPDRNKSLGRKSGETVFHAMTSSSEPTHSETQPQTRSSSSLGLYRLFGGNNSNSGNDARSSSTSTSSNRSRAYSDTVFSRPPRSSATDSPTTANLSTKSSDTLPEADINDVSTSALVLYNSPSPVSSPSREFPDPFSANATTYYTPETRIPNATPPRSGRGHSKSVSNTSSNTSAASYVSIRGMVGYDPEVVQALRTQLALQQELATQYELDLRARDELVGVLSAKLEQTEREAEKRRGVVRGWKKKVAELERACRGLEDEVSESRQESFERSVMDEASGEAMRHLHRQISNLEREKADMEKREMLLREEQNLLSVRVKEKDDMIDRLREEVSKKDEEERALQEGIREVKEQMEVMGMQTLADSGEELKALVVKGEQAYAMEQERNRAAEFAWEEERARLTTVLGEVRAERDAARNELAELEGIRERLSVSEEEVTVLKREVEAQWTNTEASSVKLEALEKERDALRMDVEALEARTSEMELEWAESENKRVEMEAELSEAWSGKDDVEKERDQLAEDLAAEREQVDQLRRELENLESQVTTAQQERQFALDDVTRLGGMLSQRNAELEEYTQKAVAREHEAEELRDELSRLRRDHARVADEKGRDFDEIVGREESARMRMEDMVREKAEAGVVLGTLRERVSTLKEEMERLRRHVHELQQESADKEVKLVQLNKQRDQDKEDRLGLNIALDSKQQELELLKRKLGVRGTGGSTPGPTSRIVNRRESSTFTTPIPMRPASSLSDAAKEAKESKRAETPSTATRALGKSVRANGASGSGTLSNTPSTVKTARFVEGSMGPPPARSKAAAGLARTPSAMSRSSSARPSLPALGASGPVAHRRASSLALRSGNVSDTSSIQEEKENAKPTPTKIPARRTSMMPSPA